MATEKRLIDARYLTSQMYLICEVCQTENIFIDAIIDEIDNAPDVDAVEVVRCKNCEFWHNETKTCEEFTTDRLPTGGRIAFVTGPEDFCSFARRRNGGTKDGI